MHFKNRVWEVPAAGLPVRRLPEHHVEEVHRDGRRGEGGPASDRHRTLPPRRGPAGRLSPLRGGAQPLAPDAGVQGAGRPPDPRRRPRAWPVCARARSTSARCSATTSTRRSGRGCASTRRRNAVLSLGGARAARRRRTGGLLPDVPVGRRLQRQEEPGERAQGAAGPEPGRRQEGHHQRAVEGPRLGDAVLVLLLPVPQGLQHGLEDPALRSRRRPRSCSPRPARPAASRCA